MDGFQVQSKACSTCIYRKDSPLANDLPRLEREAGRDRYGFFSGFRICHQSKEACCRGFWSRHKDKSAVCQIAQRLGVVKFIRSHNRGH
jgi:hypothetical protein